MRPIPAYSGPRWLKVVQETDRKAAQGGPGGGSPQNGKRAAETRSPRSPLPADSCARSSCRDPGTPPAPRAPHHGPGSLTRVCSVQGAKGGYDEDGGLTRHAAVSGNCQAITLFVHLVKTTVNRSANCQRSITNVLLTLVHPFKKQGFVFQSVLINCDQLVAGRIGRNGIKQCNSSAYCASNTY